MGGEVAYLTLDNYIARNRWEENAMGIEYFLEWIKLNFNREPSSITGD